MSAEFASDSPSSMSSQARRTAWIVWGAWLLLTAAALGYVAAFGVNVPWQDEWDGTVPFLTGEAPVTLHSLWQPHNEHRLLLPRLVWLGLGAATDYDFRATMFLNVMLLSVAAAVLLLSLKRVRGSWRLSDCLVPMVLLSWGHSLNLVWAFQIQFVLTLVLATLILAIMLPGGERCSLAASVLTTLCLLAMPLTLAAGVILAPIFAFWLVAQGWQAMRRKQLWRTCLLGSLAATVVVTAAMAFVDRRTHESPAHIATILIDSTKVMSMSFGCCARHLRYVLPWISVALCLAATAVLISTFRHRRHERVRCLGLLSFLAACVLLCLGIAYGRSDLGPYAVLTRRYATLAAPLLLVVYCVFVAYGTPVLRTRVVPALAVLVCLLVPYNMKDGYRCGRARLRLQTFEADVRAGLPLDSLVSRYGKLLYPTDPPVRTRLGHLQQAEIGYFRLLNVAPADEEAGTSRHHAATRTRSSKSRGSGPRQMR